MSGDGGSAALSPPPTGGGGRLFLHFAAPVAILSLVISLILSWFINRVTRETLETTLQDRARSLAANLAYDSELGILAGQGRLLRDLLEGVLRQDDVLYVQVIDARNVVLAEVERKRFEGVIAEAVRTAPDGGARNHSPRRFRSVHGEVFELVAPVLSVESRRSPEEISLMPERPVAASKGQGRQIGSIRLGVSAARIARTVQRFVTVVAGISLLSLLLMVTVVGITIYRVVILPTRQLAGRMKRLAAGEPATTVDIRRDDEIGQLAHAFNVMALSLNEARSGLQQKVEERTRELESEVRERRRAQALLTSQAAELEYSNAELRQFAYVASHDLQEPLRMVASYVELLARRYKGRLDSDADDFIGYAVEGATRMKELLTDLLAYTRVGSQRAPRQPLDLNFVLEGVLSNLRLSIQESGAVITQEPLPTIPADETQMVQLFQNLISNALKFRGQAAPRIHIRAEKRGDLWFLSVRDNGIGLDMQFADRIFVMFQRLNPRAQFAGTGIGLAICRKVVEGHGGEIWVESRPGHGATFYFTLSGIHDSARANDAADPDSAG